MARTVNEIYADMVATKEADKSLVCLTSSSTTAIWRLLFYVAAVSINVVEKLFDSLIVDVEDSIARMIPGSPRWYAQKALDFMKDHALIPDTDEYDTSDMDEDTIAEAKVVKYAVAVEDAESSVLKIKVAGEVAGVRCALSEEVETQLRAYIGEIKYAGVKVEIINRQPEVFNCEVDVYYNAQLLPQNVRQECVTVVSNYIENLPFNGRYTNMSLVDTLQGVDGVKIVNLKSASCHETGCENVEIIKVWKEPAAGYFSVGVINFNMIAYE